MGRTAPGSGAREAIAGRYLLLDRIAGGGMSAVWRAYDLREQEYVMDGQAQSLRLWLVAPA